MDSVNTTRNRLTNLRQVNLLHGPERCLCLLVHVPDVVVLDGEDHEPARVLPQEGLQLRVELGLLGLFLHLHFVISHVLVS